MKTGFNTRNIGVVTVARSDYGIYRPVLRAIMEEQGLRLSLIVAGAHLLPKYGMTIDEIRRDDFPVAETVSFSLEEDSPEGIAVSAGKAAESFAGCFARLRPDILLVLGDRFEMHAAALAALPFKIPVAHLHGGELTLGAIDNALRFSITALSHLHFAATETYRRRILQLGEEPWRVHLTGAPALDALAGFQPLPWEELARQTGLDGSEPPILVTFHPATLEYEEAAAQTETLLKALAAFDQPMVFTGTNADSGNRAIREKIKKYVAENRRTRWIENFGPRFYFHLLSHVPIMVGNSSSGLLEAPSFELPVVNIGSRQEGRVRAENVMDVPCDREAIVAAIRKGLSAEFRKGLNGMKNPYDAGGAAAKIIDCLKNIPLDRKLIVKRFVDYDPFKN